MKQTFKLLKTIGTVGALTAAILATAACDTKSNVEFLGKRSELKSNLIPHAALATGQGGVVNGTSTSGYKVNTTLGVQLNKTQGVTAGGYAVQLNFQGQASGQ